MELDPPELNLYQNTTEYYLAPDPTPIVSENELKIAVAERDLERNERERQTILGKYYQTRPYSVSLQVETKLQQAAELINHLESKINRLSTPTKRRDTTTKFSTPGARVRYSAHQQRTLTSSASHQPSLTSTMPIPQSHSNNLLGTPFASDIRSSTSRDIAHTADFSSSPSQPRPQLKSFQDPSLSKANEVAQQPVEANSAADVSVQQSSEETEEKDSESLGSPSLKADDTESAADSVPHDDNLSEKHLEEDIASEAIAEEPHSAPAETAQVDSNQTLQLILSTLQNLTDRVTSLESKYSTLIDTFYEGFKCLKPGEDEPPSQQPKPLS